MRIKRKLKGILIEQEVVEWKKAQRNIIRLFIRTFKGDLIFCVGLQHIDKKVIKYNLGEVIKVYGYLLYDKEKNRVTFYLKKIKQKEKVSYLWYYIYNIQGELLYGYKNYFE